MTKTIGKTPRRAAKGISERLVSHDSKRKISPENYRQFDEVRFYVGEQGRGFRKRYDGQYLAVAVWPASYRTNLYVVDSDRNVTALIKRIEKDSFLGGATVFVGSIDEILGK